MGAGKKGSVCVCVCAKQGRRGGSLALTLSSSKLDTTDLARIVFALKGGGGDGGCEGCNVNFLNAQGSIPLTSCLIHL